MVHADMFFVPINKGDGDDTSGVRMEESRRVLEFMSVGRDGEHDVKVG